MIRLKRTRTPRTLSESWVKDAYAAAEEFFAVETSSGRRALFNFDAWPWQTEHVLSALVDTSDGRCSFCSRSGRHALDTAAHRLRPPQEAVAADGRTSRYHYWWLAYEWQNLYLACGDCRRAQGSKFPTEKRRVRVGTRDELDERERPLIIDPAGEDPEPHFAYLDTGEIAWFDERGLITIETFDLNRPVLLEERRDSIDQTRRATARAAALLADEEFDRFVEVLLEFYATETPFAAVRRQFFNQWAQVRPRKIERILDQVTGGEVTLDRIAGSLRRITVRMKMNLSRRLGPEGRAAAGEDLAERLEMVRDERMSVESPRARISVPTVNTWADASAYEMGREIQEIEIRNFQGIDSMRLEIAGGTGEGSWLMLLGENGAGKTAALKAIALTLMSTQEREHVLPDPTLILRHGQKSGSVRVGLTGARNVREFKFGRSTAKDRPVSSEPRLLLAAYGATRLLPGEEERDFQDRSSRTGSLFDPRFPLTRPVDWLPPLGRDQFDAVARGLRRILQLEDDEEIRRDKGSGFSIASPRGRFGLADLSDGYRTMAVLALDMMNLFLDTWGQLDAAEGIVLIDEIGAHLHPRWQMKAVRAMRETFPRVQFIATTHDPLCLRGLRAGEVVVLRRPGGRLIAQQEGLPSVEGLTVDQLLTSEHFGLFSTLDPVTEQIFERYYELLAMAERDEAEEEDLAVHRFALAGAQQLGRTRRERLALEAVDAYLATERFATSAEDLRRLPEAARQSVHRLLEEVA